MFLSSLTVCFNSITFSFTLFYYNVDIWYVALTSWVKSKTLTVNFIFTLSYPVQSVLRLWLTCGLKAPLFFSFDLSSCWITPCRDLLTPVFTVKGISLNHLCKCRKMGLTKHMTAHPCCFHQKDKQASSTCRDQPSQPFTGSVYTLQEQSPSEQSSHASVFTELFCQKMLIKWHFHHSQ